MTRSLSTLICGRASWSTRDCDPRIAREMVLARLGDMRPSQAHLRGPWQKARAGDAIDTVARSVRDDVRFAVRQLKASPGFTFVAVAHTGARHWRQRRDLRAGRRHACFAHCRCRSLSGSWSRGSGVTHCSAVRLAAQHARLERPESHLREDGRVHSAAWAAW